MVKFKAGDIIQECKPFVHVLNLIERGKRCDHCFAPSPKLQRCSRCKVKFYCSKRCQTEDWSSGHKLGECLLYTADIQKHNGRLIDLDTPRLLLRLSLMLTKKPEIANKVCATILADGSPRTFNDLMDHKTDLEKDETRNSIFEEMCYLYSQLGVFFDPDQLLSSFGKLLINGFTIMDNTFREIGYGLYIGCSQFDHSCKPNGVPIFDGTTLRIRAMKDIDTDEEPILITYLDITQSTAQRKEILLKKYYFDCKCSRCTSGPDIEADFDSQLSVFIKLVAERRWKEADELGRELLPIFESYFQYYHPELTIHLMQLLQIRRNMGLKVFNLSDKITKDIYEKLEKSILITHGADHSLYKIEYVDILKDLNAI